ncbi:MAG TPA: SLC13 family permease, partial [Rhodospirillales bacterium]|nr:SLC13 family permease [Rhodospirillales bacterium]
MTIDQGLAFAVIGGTIACLIWGRIRYDLVALGALLAAVGCGIVPADRAFDGFGDDIVVIVGSALVVSAGISRSGGVEAVIRPIGPYLRRIQVQVPVLVTLVTVMSAMIKNIGALAILLPVSLQIARQNGTSAGRLLMPLSFGSLLGGLATLIGTSPNIIVSRVRDEMIGEPFRMFDFFPVGASLAAIGILFLSVGWRLLPSGRTRAVSGKSMFEVADYTTEVRLTGRSPLVNKTVADLEALAEGDVAVMAIVREHGRRYVPAAHWVLYEQDILVLEGEADALRKLVAAAGFELATEELEGSAAPSDHFGAFEAVVTEGSVLIGTSPQEMRLRDRFGVVLIAIRRLGQPLRQRPRLVRFQSGDLVVLHGRSEEMPETLAALGCLPLAERDLQLGRRRRIWPAVSILAAAVLLVAVELVPVTIAFFGAAVVMLLTRTLTLKDAYNHIEWPILVLLGALIPVSGALQHTGATDLIAGWLAQAALPLPPIGALALTLTVAMLVTPFLNNAATVLMMAPIGASLAGQLGLNADPFLMAVAIGAG